MSDIYDTCTHHGISEDGIRGAVVFVQFRPADLLPGAWEDEDALRNHYVKVAAEFASAAFLDNFVSLPPLSNQTMVITHTPQGVAVELLDSAPIVGNPFA